MRANRPYVQRIALGALAGAGATFLLQGLMQASAKAIPEGKAPIRKDPGEFMTDMTLPAGAPDELRKAAAKSLHLGYGTTFGGLYGAVSPRGSSPILAGTILGLGVWSTGYLGWLPALGLMPPLTRQKPKQVVVPLVQHVLFGIAVAALYRAANRR